MTNLVTNFGPLKWKESWDTFSKEDPVEVEHVFLPGLYIKRSKIKAKSYGSKHIHSYDHLSVLSSGVARVVAGKIGTTYRAGAYILIKAGVVHQVEALTDICWLCIHPTEETDIKKLEETIFHE